MDKASVVDWGLLVNKLPSFIEKLYIMLDKHLVQNVMHNDIF